jgi:RNA polymerase sigma-70 factor (ECF subfamily)
MLFHHPHYNNPARLFEAFQQGDPHAFRYFYELHHSSLYLIILGIVDDPEEAKDIVADAFAKLSDNRGKIQDAEHLGRYLFIVARNGAIDYFRKLETRRKAHSEAGRLTEAVYSEPTESEIIHVKLLEKIAQTVHQFPAKRRKIFLLFYYIGEDVRSIAHLLNLKEQTVRNQLNRAIIALRKALL